MTFSDKMLASVQRQLDAARARVGDQATQITLIEQRQRRLIVCNYMMIYGLMAPYEAPPGTQRAMNANGQTLIVRVALPWTRTGRTAPAYTERCREIDAWPLTQTEAAAVGRWLQHVHVERGGAPVYYDTVSRRWRVNRRYPTRRAVAEWYAEKRNHMPLEFLAAFYDEAAARSR